MTVSRALSGHPNVQEATRKAIQERAKELGYVRSAAARAMRGDETMIVGLLLPNIVNEFYARFANALALACDEQGLQLIIHLTGDDLDAETQALERLREVQAQTTVMVPAPGQSGHDAAQLGQMRIIHLIRQRSLETPASAVLVEDGRAIRDAVMHLAEQGHREIAYIGADDGLSSGRSRLAAFRHGLSCAGLAERTEHVSTAQPSFEMGRQIGQQLLDAGKASALVCGGFEISNGALSMLMEAARSGRHDLAFVGYGDPSFYEWIDGGISTIRIPVDLLARETVNLLVGPAPSGETTSIAFPASFVARGKQ